VITRGLRDFVSRDWGAARDAKDAYWGERVARAGPLEAFRIADELRRQALLLQPGWPDAADRSLDLQSHSWLAPGPPTSAARSCRSSIRSAFAPPAAGRGAL
jgi:hypothetical protein